MADYDENKYKRLLGETPFVFVYGTLQEGHYNNYLLSTSTKVGTMVTQDKYLLLDVGFPYAIPEKVVPEEYHEDFLHPVQGEVWEVDDPYAMYTLDRLEGEGSHYIRRMIKIDGLWVWMYQMDDLEWAARFSRVCPLDEHDQHYIWKEN